MTDLDRRQFLVNAALASAATAWVRPAPARRPKQREDPIRWAVIGTGSRGGDHLRVLSRLEGARVVAVCDIFPPHLRNGLRLAGGEEGGVKAFTDHRQLLDQGGFDAVSVATPIHTHATLAIDALEAGHHVLCEKSMAHTIAEGKRMVEAVRRTGRLLQVGLQRRYTSFYRRARWLVEQGGIGRINHATLQWHRNTSWRRPVPAPEGEWTAERLEHHINHRLYWATSGGLMAELGSHQLDVLNWMLGEMPAAVMGVGGVDCWKDGREVWDNINLIYEYPSGCKATYTSIQGNAFDGASEKLLGDEGTIILAEKGHLFRESRAKELELLAGAEEAEAYGRQGFTITSGATQTRGAAERGPGEAIEKTPQLNLDGTHVEFMEFMECIREGRQPFCGVKEGYQETVCVVLANQAMREGRRIEFSKDLWI